MCGIAGFFNAPNYNRRDLEEMTAAIRHRGPDGDGHFYLSEQGLGLGHRRLSILDLTTDGAQPMTYEDSGVWIVFNGEIYNYLELRRELESIGYRFKTRTDSEVLLAAFLEWDLAALDRFNGMWAVAVADTRKRRFILAVDRFGVKPIFYRCEKNAVAFASEQKAFWALADRHPMHWDLAGLRTALVSPGALESSGKTIFENVESLQGGQFLEITPQSFRKARWWSTGDHLVEVPASLKAQAEQFKELFFDSCRLRLRSDVPIGTSLSGGLDSSAVAAVIGKLRNEGGVSTRGVALPHKAFIHEFKGTVLDESNYAKIVTDQVGLEPVIISANADDVAAGLDDGILGFESIYPGMLDSAARVYKTQREHGCFVSLDGHGADEMLGGYHNYTYAALRQAFPHPLKVNSYLDQLKEQSGAFFSWRSLAVGLLGGMVPSSAGGSGAFLLKRIAHPVLSALRQTPLMGGFYSPQELVVPKHFDLVNRALYEDFHQKLLPRILRNFDLTSMAHGIEVRMPFMDYRLVTYAFSLPSESKIGNGYTKLIMREALDGVLPEQIRHRKLKLGFNSPLLEWLPGILRPWIENTLTQNSTCDVLIDRSKLLNYYRQHILSGRFSWNDATRFWAFVSAVRLGQLLASRVTVR